MDSSHATPEIYCAVPLTESLIEKRQEEEVQELQQDEAYRRFQQMSLVLGLLVGFFIQFSTLGANFLVITLYGEDIISKSKQDVVFISLLCSFVTSTAALIVLGYLRSIIKIAFKSAFSRLSTQIVEDIILNMECRFVVGALFGVCLAWMCTDFLLGMGAQVLYSVATLFVALGWCRLMMCMFATRRQSLALETNMLMIV